MPTEFNIQIKEGATWLRDFHLTDAEGDDVSLVDCEIKIEIRKKAGTDPLVTLNTPDEITLTNATEGRFRIYISHETTSTFTKGNYKWDCFIKYPTNPVRVDCVWEGEVEIGENITEPSTLD